MPYGQKGVNIIIVYEFKAKGKQDQFEKTDETVRVSQFILDKALRFWIDNRNVKAYDLNKYTAVLANEFEFADKLNSMANQAATEITASAVNRFFDNCKSEKAEKKGYPKFRKNCRSMEELSLQFPLNMLVKIVALVAIELKNLCQKEPTLFVDRDCGN